jgi:hypothetical protein
VLNSQTSVSPLRPARIGLRELGLAGPPSRATNSAQSTRARALETVVRWNALAARLARMLDNPLEPEAAPGKFVDVRIVNLLVDRWAKLKADDPRNLSLAELARTLGFDRTRIGVLRSARIEDLSGLAQALKAAPVIERHNALLGPANRKAKRAAIAAPISRREAAQIVADIGKSQLGMLDERKAR